MGVKFSIVQLLAPNFGLLYYYCGILIENAKRNWFVGIRTPWTLSSERAGKKRIRLGKLFKASRFIAFIDTFFQSHALFSILVPTILVAVYTIVYSYVKY